MDEGMKALDLAWEQNLNLDSAASKRIRRRADLIIMPLLCLLYGLQFLDRSSLSYASVMGFQQDLHLKGQQYSWISSIFFFGYLVVEIFTGRLLQRLHSGYYVGICCVLWGISCACFSAVRDYRSALGLRVLLGAFEACVSPAIILIISQWYTLEEQSLRTAIWVSMNGFSSIFGGLVAYGLAKDDHSRHIPAWKTVFILFGCLTIGAGIVFAIFIPRNPLRAWWLSPSDRVLAVKRVQANSQGIGTRKFKPYQLKEALIDPFTWAILLLAISCDIPNGGLINYFSQIIVSLGYTPTKSLLYGAPAGAVGAFTILLWGFLSYNYGHRLLWGLGAMMIALLGACLLVFLPHTHRAGRLVGYYLTSTVPAGLASVLSLISSNVAGYTKKPTVAAIFFVGYCIGNIVGPQTFRAEDAPNYRPAEITIVAMLCFGSADLLFLHFYLGWKNTQKKRLRIATEYKSDSRRAFMDLTDWENLDLVYCR